MAVELTVVGEIVLGGRDGLHVLGVRSHEAPDISSRHDGGEERILTEGLAGTAPSGVADGLDDRGPEGKALGTGLEDGACLVSDH